jgi:hypothetical protein
MIVFSSDKLERALASDGLDSRQKAQFVILFMCLSTPHMFSHLLGSIIPDFESSEPPGHSLIMVCCGIIALILTYVGIRKCYLTNKSADDKEFVTRFFALFFPASFKVLLVLLFFVVVSGTFAFLLNDGTLAEYFPRTVRQIPGLKNVLAYLVYPAVPLVTWLFYYALNRSFRRLAAMISAQESKTPNPRMQPIGQNAASG